MIPWLRHIAPHLAHIVSLGLLRPARPAKHRERMIFDDGKYRLWLHPTKGWRVRRA
jgi:hypothetical protein